jgi:protein subunit release factor A
MSSDEKALEKIGKLHHAERNGDYRREISSTDAIIDTVNALVDAHNELMNIVNLLLKRDEENCLEKAKAELLEAHTENETKAHKQNTCTCPCHNKHDTHYPL